MSSALTRGYLWRCETSKLTYAVLAHSERTARRWFAAHARGPATYLGPDNRKDSGYTIVMASLDENGKQLEPWRQTGKQLA